MDSACVRFYFEAHTIEKPVLKLERVLRWHFQLFGLMRMHTETLHLFVIVVSLSNNQNWTFIWGHKCNLYIEFVCVSLYALHCYDSNWSNPAICHLFYVKWNYYSPAHCISSMEFVLIKLVFVRFTRKKKRKKEIYLFFPTLNKMHRFEIFIQ